MNLFVDIIGYIGAALAGAVCLELFWYTRRRRKHQREEIEMDNVWKAHVDNETDHCPFSDEYDEEMKRRSTNNPPPVPGEKEK